MRVAVFSSKHYDKEYLEIANKKFKFDLEFYEHKLSHKTAVTAQDYDAVCVFVNDEVNKQVLQKLAHYGVKILALRCAGFDNVDLAEAKKLGITVVRVPAYSPEAVAEHAVALMMTLNRRTHKAYQRTRDANFSLDGLTGFNMHNRTAGVIGTGKIGLAVIRILKGFGMHILAHDPYPNDAAVQLGAKYVELDELYANSDVITLHCPMSPENYHLLNKESFNKMKNGVMIINTSRGGLLDSTAAIDALKQTKIGALGMDVYENERDLFFEDKSNDVILDDVFRRLSACHNVIFTGHQAFLTQEALLNISETTLTNIEQVSEGKSCPNIVE
ncbi:MULTISPECIES: 2-hydroxyacid dehydrogenase [unclassified Gilliamella]|uniref:2-hydroxyacid dehydrogenase n=1 Tax=unclassified Gilliamella TaxID=2685620 RepID=UPI001C69CF76|nr:2-hydroxyacid dehydrogenase [Gilliamella sp. B3722]MCX8608304.1 2-hydroxyacid dehydrogenase [Gilliamella sp. B3771]MCX8610263.1 2-hydroxyacid dehydrogenase [Gilliamella sp. B3891]MCX8612477.1 2-hydroxyacid dehydrogenase [Gilliamella sp. B3773]MCX8616291.1 2-hydroxyacid dehydrogenase [Gilliamella sp. B3770]MCX8618865.1 2-hydroxyacid dehydrogenase [Gilliamella sp. B2923]MCX8619970.1 2-hydroxyacid dehydrogenase [Gilliamella sp. B3892]MCX8622175.1 2-hydroxyacid dehydrogenase [Gilliamella sp. 